jgi:hypothetical protein
LLGDNFAFGAAQGLLRPPADKSKSHRDYGRDA